MTEGRQAYREVACRKGRPVDRVQRGLLACAACLLVLAGELSGGLSNLWAEQPVSFNEDVIPVLTRFGCNAGGCHGKLAGQNGFRLSLRGYAPEWDHESLTRQARGRRIHPAAPRQSLLLLKALGQMPHGGGRRFDEDSPAARLLADWIAAGADGPRADEARVDHLEIVPATATMTIGQAMALTVTAVYQDGRRRDVTWLTQFASSDSGLLDVTPEGQVQALRHGEAVVRATFQGYVEIATLTVPYDTPSDPKWYATKHNEIDEHVFAKLSALGIEPSPLCDDATFIRRAYLDGIGTLPTPDEVRAFLADNRADKRQRLVDQLLERPEFVDFWTLWLGDLLQNRKERDHDVRGAKGVRSLHHWLRQQVSDGRSWRDITSAVLTASGPCDQQPAVGYYVVTVGEKPAEQSELADSVAQAFLGTRIGCARCHNHPLENFTQDDYYHFVAFFSRLALERKKPEDGPTELVTASSHELNLRRQVAQRQQKLNELRGDASQAQQVDSLEKQIADLGQQIDAARRSPVTTLQPRTGQNLQPRPLDRTPLEVVAGQDPREALLRWVSDPANRYFSGAMVNRLWKHFLGVGLVEPVDDLRATNPPSNGPLWDLLNREFVSGGHDWRQLMRLIMNSRTYQLSAETRPGNFRDDRFYSHYYARRLSAEVLLDAICQATAEPEPFPGYPLGVRAIQVPDPGTESYFLTLFGRSERTTACACERSGDVTLPQLLHLQNSDNLLAKLKSPAGRLSKLLASPNELSTVLDELFLCTLSRLSDDEERSSMTALLADGDRGEALQDAFWALLNSKEFAFNH